MNWTMFVASRPPHNDAAFACDVWRRNAPVCAFEHRITPLGCYQGSDLMDGSGEFAPRITKLGEWLT